MLERVLLEPPVNISPTNKRVTMASTSTVPAPATKKRVRTGCLNCRRKHKKCDETHPICRTCQLKNESCEWPTPKLKKSSSRRSSHCQQSASLTTSNINSSANVPPPVSATSQNYPIYSAPIPNQAPIHHLNRPRLENTSPLEQHTTIQPPVSASSTTFPPPASSSHHPISQYLPINYEPQQPRRISADLSSYSLGNSMPQYQNHQQSSESYLDQQRVPGPTKLNLNNLLNTQYEPQQVTKRISIDSSETQYTNSSISSSKNGGELTPISTTSVYSSSSKVPSPSFDIPAFKNLSSTLRHYLKTGSIIQKFQTVQLSELEEISLLQTYITEISPKLDILNSQFIKYGIPQLAKQSACVKFAMYATGFFHTKSYEMGMKLYYMSLNYIRMSSWLEKVVSTTLLSFISTMVLDPEEWRGEIRDLVQFMDSGAEPIMECYWWAVLMDINSMEIGEDTTVFQNNKAGNDVSEIIKLFAMVVNLISMDFVDFDQRWELLWNDVNHWYETRSKYLVPLLEFESPMFPIVSFGAGSFALANQLYHTVIILLVQNKPRLYKIRDFKNVRPITWHAKQIIGITLHNESIESWNNSNQCLWIAGKLLTHQDEHKTIVNLISDIELKTGCCFRYKGVDLKNYWDGKTDL